MKNKKNTYIIGIDPGKSGGIAIFKNEELTTYKLPLDEEGNVNVVALYQLLLRYIEVEHCIIEKVWGKGYGYTEFIFGEVYGMTKAAILIAGIELEYVTPANWMKYYGMKHHRDEARNNWKGRLKDKAQQLFPDYKCTLWNCDAILIANYCKQINKK